MWLREIRLAPAEQDADMSRTKEAPRLTLSMLPYMGVWGIKAGDLLG
jgi:hypothetical protein